MLAIMNADVLSVQLNGDVIRAQALAAERGRIIYAGNDDGLKDILTENAQVIDARGNTVLPGLCDAHLHIALSGGALFSCALDNLEPEPGKNGKVKKYQKTLARYIEENRDNKIIKGSGWDIFDFFPNLPNRSMLDEVCSDRPVVLESYCLHHLWLNSKALELTGIAKETPDPRNGILHRDKNGNLTGVFSEFSAIEMVKRAIPELDCTIDEYKEIIRHYQEKYAKPYGITLVFDALSTDNAHTAFRELARDKELTFRVRDNYYADPTKPLSQFADIIRRTGSDDVEDLYARRTVKFFMESSVPDTFFSEPYNPLVARMYGRKKGHRGYAFWTREELREVLPLLMEAGLQVHSHAMGDAAVTHTIDAYEYARAKTGKETRNTIAHLMYVRPGDMKRMGENKILACVQPTWMAMKRSDWNALSFALGRRRAERLYPYKRLLDEGVLVSAGTDFPVTQPPDPFIEMEHAVRRELSVRANGYRKGKGVKLGPKRNPGQDAVNVLDVIKSRTICGAYQCFAEEITGSVEVGKSADLVILDRKIEDVPPEKLHECAVDKTIFKGEIVYRRGSF